MNKRIISVLRIGYVVSYSVLLFSAVLSEPLRYRRQSSPNYAIDVLVVVDDVMFSRFQQWMVESPSVQSNGSSADVSSKIKEYVSLIVHQANDRLLTLNKTLSYRISLQIVDIRINVSILGSANTNEKIFTIDALNVFKSWVQTSDLTSHDHAVLLTGHTLANKGTQDDEVAKGRSFNAQMCETSGFSTSVIHENGGFQSVYHLVHELAHSLGAQHDDATPSCFNRYIMSSHYITLKDKSNIDHPWYFSNCSAQKIDDLVKQLMSLPGPGSSSFASDCLSVSQKPIAEFTSTLENVSGQLYKADVQCQMIHGNKSHLCLGDAFPALDRICDSMYCLDPLAVGDQCLEYIAAEGTSCGDKQWCKLGLCVYSESAPSMNLDKCPNGDQETTVNGMDCRTAVRGSPMLCYNLSISTNICCQTCAKIRGNLDACPYGDRQKSCVQTYCRNSDYSKQCCGTCSSKVLAPKCEDVSNIDGVTCKNRVTMDGHQGCYNDTVAKNCCLACSEFRTTRSGCQYGDYLLNNVCASVKTNYLCNDRQADCCHSCFNTAVTTFWTLLPISAFITLWTFYKNVVKFI